jgi:hypothetical protein
MFMYMNSGLPELMEQPEFNGACLFADQGYARFNHLLSPHETKGGKRKLTTIEAEFNRSMLMPRLRVEHGFMRVTQLFPFFQRPSKLRAAQMSLATHYEIAVLFTNIRTCLDGGNQISRYFQCAPCSVIELLNVRS